MLGRGRVAASRCGPLARARRHHQPPSGDHVMPGPRRAVSHIKESGQSERTLLQRRTRRRAPAWRQWARDARPHHVKMTLQALATWPWQWCPARSAATAIAQMPRRAQTTAIPRQSASHERRPPATQPPHRRARPASSRRRTNSSCGAGPQRVVALLFIGRSSRNARPLVQQRRATVKHANTGRVAID